MPFDPTLIIMLLLIVVLIFFMFRNGRKRQQAMAEMQNKMRPGAEVMTQSGIYGTVEEIDEADNRVTLRSGTSTLVVHRNAISQVVSAAADDEVTPELAPDDDPEFGERLSDGENGAAKGDDSAPAGDGDAPKA